jgi:indolepyruvate ferredoxin oxidoreductase
MAAHLEDRRVCVSDLTGLAQKNGAVFSHVRITSRGARLWGARIGAGEADLLVACDAVATATSEVLATIASGRTTVLLNNQVAPTGEFQRNADIDLSNDRLRALIAVAAGENNVIGIDASALATDAAGDASATNLFMLGFALQRGLLPVNEAAIVRAIELNGASIERNVLAFRLGRLACHDPQAFRSREPHSTEPPRTLDELVAFGCDHLRAYQGEAYARAYGEFIADVRVQEQSRVPGKDELARAVAVSLLKLMAYKDEYEVARLHASEDFRRDLLREFEGPLKLTYHLAPPMLGPRKIALGSWMSRVFQVLAALKGLRGTPFDPFGYTLERRTERALVQQYRRSIRRLLAALHPASYSLAIAIAELPQGIRGFGHVKRAALERVRSDENRLWSSFERNHPEGAVRDAPDCGRETS